LTVGEGVVLNGTFVVPDIASVSARELIVASSGVIKGKVTAEIIDLRGEIHDTLTAKKSLFIRSTGKALGSVQYAEIEIEKGGDLQGALQKIDGEGGSSSSSGSY
jgi:cytoskeletal protein CcmA (bactofilin family)